MPSCTQQIFDLLPTKRTEAISYCGLRSLLPRMDKANFSNALSMLKKNGVIQYERQRSYFRLPNAVRPNSAVNEELNPVEIVKMNVIAALPLIRITK